MKRNWETDTYEMSTAEWHSLMDAVGISRATFETMIADERRKEFSTPFPLDWMQQKHDICMRALDILWMRESFTSLYVHTSADEQLNNSAEAETDSEVAKEFLVQRLEKQIVTEEEAEIADAEWSEAESERSEHE